MKKQKVKRLPPRKRVDKCYEGAKGYGRIHVEALFMRIEAGQATDPETGVTYELSMTPGGQMLVENPKLRRYFCLAWADAVRLAQEAGIDGPLDKLTEVKRE